jgi:hypothetical protein
LHTFKIIIWYFSNEQLRKSLKLDEFEQDYISIAQK